MATLDRTIEALHHQDIELAALVVLDDDYRGAVVDEAVELAKELSTDDSPAFVNGVLAKIAELAPQVRAAASAEPGGAAPGRPEPN